MRGDLAGHLRSVLRRVETVRVGEDGPERLGVRRKIGEVEPVAMGVGEVAVAPRAVERRVEVEAVADVADDEERGRLIERLGVADGLAPGVPHRDGPA